MRSRLLVAFALLVTACSGPSADTTTTTTTSIATTTTESTTTTEPTTTTTVDDRPRAPLTGLPMDDEELLERRVLAVKVDNHWNARPQSGILEADAVFEILVEGGLTRLMTVFHTTDSHAVGPIRSGRPSDAAIIRPLDAVLAISGGQPWIRAGIEEVGVPYLSDTRPGMYRVDFGFAPHNLYGDTLELRQVADDRGIPDEAPTAGLWEFGDELDPAAADATHVSFTFSPTTTTDWYWDGETWWRSIDGEESTWMPPTDPVDYPEDYPQEGEGDGDADSSTTTTAPTTSTTEAEVVEPERIDADVLIAIVGRQYVASPPAGGGSSVPATETVGSGPVYVFADGKVMEGTWEREETTDPFTFQTAAGEPLLVPPGRPWISIVPDQGEVAFEDTPATSTTTSTTEPSDG
jgi:hypothetical protein